MYLSARGLFRSPMVRVVMLTIEVTTNLPEGRQQLKPTDLAIDS